MCTFLVPATPTFTAEGMVSKDVIIYVVAADAWDVGRVDRESEFVANA